MTAQMDWDRLARYVSGEATGGERREVEHWASESPENAAALESARRRWTAASDTAQWDVDRAWARLQPKLGRAPSAPSVLPLSRPERNPWLRASRLVPLAAAAALVVAVALQVDPGDSAPGTVATVPGGLLQTGIGEQRTVDLPDGSRVHLGADSRLRLGDGFGESTREVFLEGQAFIRVTHDASRPFVVNAGGTRTVDLGTAFEVRAYPSEDVRVVVSEGSVEVRRDDPSADPVAVLQAGDFARLSGTSADVRRQQDVGRLLGWTRGELSFDDAPLSEIALELQRWYDVECRIDDRAIQDLHFSVNLRIGESLDEILNLVELALSSRGVRAERQGRVVRFRLGTPVNPASLAAPVGRSEVGA